VELGRPIEKVHGCLLDVSTRLLAHTRPQSQHPQMKIRTLTETDAEAVATWRYPGRYQTYDVSEVITSEAGFWAVEHEATLVGYCCFGHEARVPGAVEEAGILDIGYGMRPDFMGQGLGREFVGAILDFAVRRFSPSRLRLLILDWNDRSRKVAVALGFKSEGVLRSAEGDFLVMTRATPERRPAPPSPRHPGE
jgi:[ribosomal protein S18]-alanine N-acetyltransferase